MAAADAGEALQARRRDLLRALHVERLDEGGGLEPAADLPAALLPGGGVPRLRAARAPLHRVRDAPLPRALLRAGGRGRLRGARRGHAALPARAVDRAAGRSVPAYGGGGP